jgi:hypothetical protein
MMLKKKLFILWDKESPFGLSFFNVVQSLRNCDLGLSNMENKNILQFRRTIRRNEEYIQCNQRSLFMRMNIIVSLSM